MGQSDNEKNRHIGYRTDIPVYAWRRPEVKKYSLYTKQSLTLGLVGCNGLILSQTTFLHHVTV